MPNSVPTWEESTPVDAVPTWEESEPVEEGDKSAVKNLNTTAKEPWDYRAAKTIVDTVGPIAEKVKSLYPEPLTPHGLISQPFRISDKIGLSEKLFGHKLGDPDSTPWIEFQQKHLLRPLTQVPLRLGDAFLQSIGVNAGSLEQDPTINSFVDAIEKGIASFWTPETAILAPAFPRGMGPIARPLRQASKNVLLTDLMANTDETGQRFALAATPEEKGGAAGEAVVNAGLAALVGGHKAPPTLEPRITSLKPGQENVPISSLQPQMPVGGPIEYGPREKALMDTIATLEGEMPRERLAEAKFDEAVAKGQMDKVLGQMVEGRDLSVPEMQTVNETLAKATQMPGGPEALSQGGLVGMLAQLERAANQKQRSKLMPQLEQTEAKLGQLEERAQTLAQTVERLDALRRQEQELSEGVRPDYEQRLAQTPPVIGEAPRAPSNVLGPQGQNLSPRPARPYYPGLVTGNLPTTAPRVQEGRVGHGGVILPQEQAGGRVSFSAPAGQIPLGGGIRPSNDVLVKPGEVEGRPGYGPETPVPEGAYGPEFQRFKDWATSSNDKLTLENVRQDWHKQPFSDRRTEALNLIDQRLRELNKPIKKEPIGPLPEDQLVDSTQQPPQPGLVKDVLTRIANNPNGRFNALAQRLLEIGEKEGLEEPTEIDPTMPSRGVAGEHLNTGKVLINPSYVHNDSIWLHEILHALTYTKLRRSILSSYKQGPAHIKALQDYLTTGKDPVVKDLINLYLEAKRKVSPADQTLYGMSDIQEFISEAWSNKRFQNVLKSIKTDKASNKTLWDKLKDAVKRMVGMDVSDSMLSEVLEASGKLVQKERPKPQGGDRFTAERTEGEVVGEVPNRAMPAPEEPTEPQASAPVPVKPPPEGPTPNYAGPNFRTQVETTSKDYDVQKLAWEMRNDKTFQDKMRVAHDEDSFYFSEMRKRWKYPPQLTEEGLKLFNEYSKLAGDRGLELFRQGKDYLEDEGFIGNLQKMVDLHDNPQYVKAAGTPPDRATPTPRAPEPSPEQREAVRKSVEQLSTREKELRGEGFALSTPRLLVTSKEIGFTDVTKDVDATQLWNRVRNKLPVEAEVLEAMGVGKAVRDKGKISPTEAAKIVQEMGPRIEVKRLEAGAASEAAKEHAKLTHEWFERQPNFLRPLINDFEEAVNDGLVNEIDSARRRLEEGAPKDKEWWDALDRWVKSSKARFEQPHTESATATYTQVNPRPLDKMPGAVDILVRVPRMELPSKPGTRFPQRWTRVTSPSGEAKIVEPPKYESGHYPTEGKNLVAHVRGWMEDRPEGKTFVVFEEQSDWAQARRNVKELDEQGENGRYGTPAKIADDPLLKHWERLALKAAIEHAKKNGATKVAVVDAKTAMMTEGQDNIASLVESLPTEQVYKVTDTGSGKHSYKYLTSDPTKSPRPYWAVADNLKIEKATGTFVRLGQAGNELRARESDVIRVDVPEDNPNPEIARALQPYAQGGNYIPQERGMTLHYDQIIPRIMEELTGEKGELRSFGTHQNAVEAGGRIGIDSPEILEGDRRAGFNIEGTDRLYRPRQNLIFRNPDGTPKTDITARVYDISKAKAPFSLFEKDKPATRPTYLYSAPGMFFDPEFYKKSYDQAKQTGEMVVKGVINKFYGGGAEPGVSEGLRVIINKMRGYSTPHHVAANEGVANKMNEFLAADFAGGAIARAQVSLALGERWKDADFDARLGKVLVEDRLRTLEQMHRDKGQNDLADAVNSVMSEAEFRKAMRDPVITKALDRHKVQVQQFAGQMHKELGGRMARPGQTTDAFVNLLDLAEGTFEEKKKWIYGKGDRSQKSVIRESAFNKPAAGVGKNYETSYRKLAERMIRANYSNWTKKNWIEAAVEAGVYKLIEKGATIPEGRGKIFPVEMGQTPWGMKVDKKVWVPNNLVPEVSQAFEGGEHRPKMGAKIILDALTEFQVFGVTDAAYHTANMFGTIAGMSGKSKAYLTDLALSVPVAKQLDTFRKVTYEFMRVLADTPEVQKELADIAKINALRPESTEYMGTWLGRMTGFDTGKFIRLVDRAGRLALNKMYDNLVEQGLTKDNVLDRREFINKMGQYNPKAMRQYKEFMRTYFSQFIVAGQQMNANGVRRLLGVNDVRAANAGAFLKMQLSNRIAIVATVLALPIAFNLMRTGKPFGRPGTPVGKIDTNKDDEDGRHITFDFGQTDLVRRGLRVTGGQALLKGIHEDKSANQILEDMFVDILKGQAHPFMGPPTRAAAEGVLEYAKTGGDMSEALGAAAKQTNPLMPSVLDSLGVTEEDKYDRGFVEQMGGVIGVGKSRMPTHEERLIPYVDKIQKERPGTGPFTARIKAERMYEKEKPNRTWEEKHRGGEYAMRREKERRETLLKSLSKEATTFIKLHELEVPSYNDKITYKHPVTDEGTVIVLRRSEQDRLAELMREEYETVVAGLRNDDKFRQLPLKRKQERAHERFIRAAEKARERLLSEIRKQ